jgi:hypothetical protein
MDRKGSKMKFLSRWQIRRNLQRAVDAHLEDIHNQSAEGPAQASGIVNLANEIVSVNHLTETGTACLGDEAELEPCESEGSQSDYEDALSDFDDDYSGCVDSDSSSNGGENDDAHPGIHDFLREWGFQHNITQSALSDLLKGLRFWHPDLPKDARTLRQTPCVAVDKMGDGEFFYFGLVKSLEKHLEVAELISNSKALHLTFNVDGLPVCKSSSTQLWPILCLIKEDVSMSPFPIAIYCGSSKPPVAEFFESFVVELKSVLENGLLHDDKYFDVNIRGFVCDTPAKAFIKCTKGHNGFFGCDGCSQKGKHVEHRLVFLEQDAPLRTDQSFSDKSNREHHKEIDSPLEKLGIGLVSNFPLDYMHLVCLGVMRRLLMAWKSGPRKTRLLGRSVQVISDYMLQAIPFWPCEFSRKPRSLKEIDRWKATEFRQFLLYLGPVVLKDVLTEKLYGNFMLFFVALTYIVSERLHEMNDYANELLRIFVSNSEELYGETFVVYNVHSLIHLCQHVRRLGPVDSFSAFPFENYLGQLKKLLHSGNKPLQQVCRRLSERGHLIHSNKKILQFEEILTSKFTPDGGSVLGIIGAYFKKIRGPFFRLSTTNVKDNCVFLKNGQIVRLKYFVKDESGSLLMVCKRFCTRDNFFVYPCESSAMSIFFVTSLSRELSVKNVDKIDCKAVCLPYKDGYVCMPMHHIL